MELDDLLKLIDHVSKSKLDDFCYETGEIKLRLKKNAAKEIVVQQKEVKNAASEFAIVQNCEDVFDADTSKKTDEASSDKYIDSPLVGIFYTAPGEGEAPFVSVGDRVKKGQTLGMPLQMKTTRQKWRRWRKKRMYRSEARRFLRL